MEPISQTQLLLRVGALSAVIATVLAVGANRLFPPKVDVVQRTEIRRTVGVLGGPIDPSMQQQRCPNNPNQSCPVAVTASIDSQGICSLKVDFGVVHPKKNQKVVWTIPATVQSTEATPRTFNLMFHKENGIQVLGNLALDGDATDPNDRLIVNCQRTGANRQEFSCQSSNANTSGNKHQTKAMAYNIIAWYDTAAFTVDPPNSGTSQLCILDPVIVNRG